MSGTLQAIATKRAGEPEAAQGLHLCEPSQRLLAYAVAYEAVL